MIEPVLRPISGGQVAKPLNLREARIDEWMQAKSFAVNTSRSYRHDLTRFLDWSNEPWAGVSARQVAQFKDFLLHGNKPLSAATVRRVLGTLGNFYEWMVATGYVEKNPAKGVDLPKVKEPEAQNLTDAQVAKIYAATEDSMVPLRDRALIAVLGSGLRAQSVSALELRDYDQQSLHVRTDKNNSHGTVPLAAATVNALEDYLEWRSRQGEGLTLASPLFVSHSNRNRGDRLSYQGIRKVVDTLAEKSGVDFHAHQLRHTFGTNLALSGIDAADGMTLMRHKSVAVYRRYTQAALERRASDAFYRAIGEDVPTPRSRSWSLED